MPRTGSAALAMFLLTVMLSAPCRHKAVAERIGDRAKIPDVDPEVNTVLTGGCWHRNASEGGRYRLIVTEGGFEELFHTAYVQVMQVSLERGLETVARTVPIAETEDGQYLVTFRNVTLATSVAAGCNDAVFTGHIVRRTREHTISERQFRLQVRQDGTYAWTETAGPAHKP